MTHPLKALIQEKGISIKFIATILGYAYVTFTKQVNGKDPISNARVTEVCKYLKVSPKPYLKPNA